MRIKQSSGAGSKQLFSFFLCLGAVGVHSWHAASQELSLVVRLGLSPCTTPLPRCSHTEQTRNRASSDDVVISIPCQRPCRIISRVTQKPRHVISIPLIQS